MTTERASYLFPEKSVDICFVDADHSYDGVYKDSELWTPKREGGIISGHDYDPTGNAWQECRGLLMTIGVNLKSKVVGLHGWYSYSYK